MAMTVYQKLDNLINLFSLLDPDTEEEREIVRQIWGVIEEREF